MVQPTKPGQVKEKVPTATELATKRKSTIDELRKLKQQKAAEQNKVGNQTSSVKAAPVNVKEFKGIKGKQEEKSRVSVYEANEGCCKRFFSKVKNFFSN
jgi:hypothetical protein